MTPDEREQRIAELRDQIAAGEARIAERQAAREADPAGFDRAEREHESIGSPYVQKKHEAGDLVYRVTETPLTLAPVPGAAASSADQDWREEVVEAVSELVVHERQRERQERAAEFVTRDRRISELEGELRETKGMLADVLKRFERAEDVARNLAASVAREHQDRQALYAAMEQRFAGLNGLVRGFMQDWNAPV
jgi:hypothetical protein